MKLVIQVNPRFDEVSAADAPWMSFLASLAAEIGEKADAVELSFTDDLEIRELNTHWRDKNTATDVLSFSYGRSAPDELAPEDDPVGEIVISVETAREQARSLGHGSEEELSLLAIHGLFHIIGMDHEDEDEAERMAQAEDPFRRRLASFFKSSSDNPPGS